ncbi:MAG TPA: MBL fold metallo-hydrolase, partial [Candidatus Limnocylindria bacterium]|nr:MBL fold metallo-hydrolase [Candidatus Limnocylindria bacterium]
EGPLDRPEVVAGSFTLHDLEPGTQVALGPFQVRSLSLPHPRPNLGFRLSVDGRSLVYTGDCGPSDALVELAAGADLLLAEASYAEAVPAEIIGALSSAADVGREAAAAAVGRLVLTHLMPRTDASQATTAAARAFSGPITVARAGLRIDV